MRAAPPPNTISSTTEKAKSRRLVRLYCFFGRAVSITRLRPSRFFFTDLIGFTDFGMNVLLLERIAIED
jgi:hypothetical protein